MQQLRLLVRPLSRRLKLDWLPALRRSTTVNRLRAVRARATLVLRPESADANVRLGEALLGLGDDMAAYDRLRKAAELDTELFDVRWRISTTLYNRGDYPGAMRAAREAIEAQWAVAEERGLHPLGLRFLGAGWTVMIGHLAFLDVYVKLALLDGVSLENRVLLVDPGRVANAAYLSCWRPYFPTTVEQPEGIRALAAITRYLEEHHAMLRLADGRMRTLHQAAAEAEARWLAEGRGPLLQITDEQEARGRATLERLGVPPDAWFVALHVREGGPPWRDIHNADVRKYTRAIEAIAARGGWVVRMGNPTMRPLPSVPHAIDYAHSEERSDWMDVFLWARSRFLVGTASGPVGVPPTFGVPCVQTNWAPLAFRHWFHGDLFVPKLYERDGRTLTFGELLSSPIGYATFARRLRERAGVSIVENTPEEIADVVVEMIDRLEGSARYDAQDEELQERFEALHPADEFAYARGSRVGREWLRAHAGLLD